MKFLTALPYKFIPMNGTIVPSEPEMAFIVKASFGLQNWRHPLDLPADEQADFAGDERYMYKIGRSLRGATDLELFKPQGEVLLTAECHAPDGAPATEVEAGLDIGPISKRLKVFGDRVWLRDENGDFRIEGPVPFTAIPLRWERAFGGLDVAENPMGRGIEPWIAEDGRKLFYLANIEAPDRPVRDQGQRPKPVCFAPVSPQWQPRLGRLGTRDQHWATFVAPLPPRDHDPRAAQAAPDDQWLDGYWTGDERIELHNLHPQHARYVTCLPARRLRLFFEKKAKTDGERLFGEVPLNLDTVHIDATKERLHLLWRQHFRPATPDGSEIEAVYLAEEPLGEPPATREKHYRDYLALKGPEIEPREVQMLRDEQAALAEARKTLVEAKIDPATIARFDAAAGTEAKFRMMMDLMKAKTAELEAMTRALT